MQLSREFNELVGGSSAYGLIASGWSLEVSDAAAPSPCTVRLQGPSVVCAPVVVDLGFESSKLKLLEVLDSMSALLAQIDLTDVNALAQISSISGAVELASSFANPSLT